MTRVMSTSGNYTQRLEVSVKQVMDWYNVTIRFRGARILQLHVTDTFVSDVTSFGRRLEVDEKLVGRQNSPCMYIPHGTISTSMDRAIGYASKKIKELMDEEKIK